jgi:hypothetical protein
MVKSSKEFEYVMCEVLKRVRDNKGNFSDLSEKYIEDEIGEALAECADEKLVSGYTYKRDNNEPVFDYSNPKITYSGLKFLDDHVV